MVTLDNVQQIWSEVHSGILENLFKDDLSSDENAVDWVLKRTRAKREQGPDKPEHIFEDCADRERCAIRRHIGGEVVKGVKKRVSRRRRQ